VPAIPIGGLRMIDAEEADDKTVAVLQGDAAFGALTDLSQVPAALVTRLQHYFLTYKMSPDRADRVVTDATPYSMHFVRCRGYPFAGHPWSRTADLSRLSEQETRWPAHRDFQGRMKVTITPSVLGAVVAASCRPSSSKASHWFSLSRAPSGPGWLRLRLCGGHSSSSPSR
jgi:hypothetical protein